MGNKSIVPVVDDGLAYVKKNFNLSDRDISQFWLIFEKFDKHGSKIMPIDEFFVSVLGESRTYFGDAIFELIEIQNENFITFREFVGAICTFALFQREDIAKVVFFVFDRKKKGYINHEAFQIFIDMSYGGKIKGNVSAALTLMNLKDDGIFEFGEFYDLCKQYPDILRPAVRLQNKMRSIVFGEEWWIAKMKRLQFEREHYDENCEKKRLAEEKRLMGQRRKRIRAELGFFQYYFSRQRRKQIEDIIPKPIVYLDKDSTVKVKLPPNKYDVVWKENEGYVEAPRSEKMMFTNGKK